MNINGNNLRKGDVIQMNGELYVCLKAEHRTPGNKRAFVQACLRRVTDGIQKDVKFSATETLEKVDLIERPMQFLYRDGDVFHFMDTGTYDQIELNRDFIGELAVFLTEGLNVNVTFHEQTPIALKLPPTMEFEITEADPEIKGATASAQYKNARIDIGVAIKVPGFVKVGDRVRVNTETFQYLERVKK